MNSLNHLENILRLSLRKHGSQPLTTEALLVMVICAIQLEARQADHDDEQWRALHDEIDPLGQES